MKRVLVVDDEINMRHMLQVMLTKAGYFADAAGDGFEALEAAQSITIQMIDHRVPEGRPWLRHLYAPSG